MNVRLRSALRTSILISGFLITSTSLAADYYVSPSGSDANDGTIANPLRSISHAISLVGTGTQVIVRAGTYPESITINASGSATAPIVIEAYPGERPVIQPTGSSIAVSIYGSYVTFSGFEVAGSKSAGIYGYNIHNVAITNNVVHDSAGAGIEVEGDRIGSSYSNLLQANTVYNNVLNNANEGRKGGGWAEGINVAYSSNTRIIGNSSYENWGEGIGTYLSDGIVISGNRSYDNYSVNIYLDNSTNATVDGNFAYTTSAARLQGGHSAVNIGTANESYSTSNPSQNNRFTNNVTVNGRYSFYYGAYNNGGGLRKFLIANNTFVNPEQSNIQIEADSGTSGTSFVNNIISRTGSGLLFSGSASGISSGFNCWFGGSAGALAASSDVSAKPLFGGGTSTQVESYGLQSASPCAGNGETLTTFSTDFNGATRTATWSMGAFNVASASATPTPVPTPKPTPAPSQVNLLLNGGFESGGASWVDLGNSVVQNANVFEGRSALRVGPGAGGRRQPVNAVVGGATYEMTLNGKVPSGRDEKCYAGFSFKDAQGRVISAPPPSATVTSGGWSTSSLELMAQAPANAVSASVWIWKEQSSGDCFVDNVKFFRK